jgi:hypothetical protein
MATAIPLVTGTAPAGAAAQGAISSSGPQWNPQAPATSSPARHGASTAYDESTGNVVLFGGLGSSGPFNDTWLWE